MIWLTLTLGPCLAFTLACGRKGEPLPRPRTAPAACRADWIELRKLELVLPGKDVQGSSLVGLEAVRIYYLPLDAGRPEPQEVLERGEIILERRRPDLPDPGKVLRLDLSRVDRPKGWMVAVAVRVGNVVGAPSILLPWLDPRISPAPPAPRPTTPPPPQPASPSAGAPVQAQAPGA